MVFLAYLGLVGAGGLRWLEGLRLAEVGGRELFGRGLALWLGWVGNGLGWLGGGLGGWLGLVLVLGCGWCAGWGGVGLVAYLALGLGLG